MSSIIGRAAFRATSRLRIANTTPLRIDTSPNPAKEATESLWKKATHGGKDEGHEALRLGAKRDPELFPLYVITAAMLGWAGYRFVESPTGADQSHVNQVEGSEPWKNENTKGKYQYHGRDGPKDHPSAVNTVIIPNVTLPKHLHEQYNKFGKQEYDV